MRMVTHPVNDDVVTRTSDPEDTCVEVIEPDNSLGSLSNYLQDHNMAAVFPVPVTSGSVGPHNGISGATSWQQRYCGETDAASKLRQHVYDGKNCIQQRKSTNFLTSERANSSRGTSNSQQDDQIPQEHCDASKGTPYSGFQNKIVTACIEHRTVYTSATRHEPAKGHAQTGSTDSSGSREGNNLQQKIPQPSLYTPESVSSTPSSGWMSPHSIRGDTTTDCAIKTPRDTMEPTLLAVDGDRQGGTPSCQGRDAVTDRCHTVSVSQELAASVTDRCHSVSVSQELAASITDRCHSVSVSQELAASVIDRCHSVSVSQELAASVTDVNPTVLCDNQPDTPVTQNTGPQGSLTHLDDVITTEAMSRPPPSVTSDLPGSSGQRDDVKVRKSLSARISRRFGNFFQKPPRNVETASGCPQAEGQGRGGTTSGKKEHDKKTNRHSSFTGRLVTSVAEWRRKSPSKPKKCSKNEKKETSRNKEEKDEPQNNNKRVPIFVLPQDQVEIVEDAPAGIGEQEKGLLRDSWAIIKSDVEEVGVETFMGLFHTHPDSIDSFLAFKDKSVEDLEQSAVLKAHALRVMQTVDKCVTRLDDQDKMAAILCQLGRRHVGYRANASLVPMIGKQFISAIQPKMAGMWSEDLCRAWDILFQNINYNLRRGMMQEKHRLQDQGVATTTTRKKNTK